MDEYLLRNFFLMNAILAVVAGFAAWQIAGKLPRGWLTGVLGLCLVVAVSWTLGAIVTLIFIASGNPGSTRVITSDPSGAAAFFIERGIELVLGAAVAIISYSVARWRRRQPFAA
jgi:hypothetical protein